MHKINFYFLIYLKKIENSLFNIFYTSFLQYFIFRQRELEILFLFSHHIEANLSGKIRFVKNINLIQNS